MSTDTRGEIRVEDMPSLDAEIACGTWHGPCPKPARMRLVGHCCPAWGNRAKYPPFLCVEHYVKWIMSPVNKKGIAMCPYCKKRSTNYRDFGIYKEM